MEEQEEAGLEQGEGEQRVGLMLLAEGNGEVLEAAALIRPGPGVWLMWSSAGCFRNREEGRAPLWPPEAPIITCLLLSRLERGSWPPLAARAWIVARGLLLMRAGFIPVFTPITVFLKFAAKSVM